MLWGDIGQAELIYHHIARCTLHPTIDIQRGVPSLWGKCQGVLGEGVSGHLWRIGRIASVEIPPPGGAIGRRGVADHIGVAGVGDEGWQQG